jgi:hypothetical protein
MEHAVDHDRLRSGRPHDPAAMAQADRGPTAATGIPAPTAGATLRRAATAVAPTMVPSLRIQPMSDATVIRRKKGKGGGKGGGNRGKKRVAKAPNVRPAPVESPEELARRAEEERRRAEEEAARKAEEERLAAEALAARKARGVGVWRRLTGRLWATVPEAIKQAKDDKNKAIFTRKPLTDLMAATFADLKASLESGEFGDDITDEELVGDEAALTEEFEDVLWGHLGATLGSAAPTKGALFDHIGWPGIKGKAWNLKALGTAPSGTKVHITVSGDSMRSPQTIVANDAGILDRRPSEIFDALFLIDDNNHRVHCTLESTPKKHLFLGGRNGEGQAIAPTGWGGDAAFLHDQLAAFRTGVEAKLVQAKLAGWRI